MTHQMGIEQQLQVPSPGCVKPETAILHIPHAEVPGCMNSRTPPEPIFVISISTRSEFLCYLPSVRIAGPKVHWMQHLYFYIPRKFFLCCVTLWIFSCIYNFYPHVLWELKCKIMACDFLSFLCLIFVLYFISIYTCELVHR